MKFVDHVLIDVAAGAGGDGCISFRREKFVPKGGPNGGNGGNGGSVYLIGDKGLQTLADLEYKCNYKAQRGQHGKGQNCYGKAAEDIYIKVPLGTDVYDAETDRVIGEVLSPKQTLLVAQGGRGGRGNTTFMTPTNRAPRVREKGYTGEIRKLKLVLRMIADIGLVGLPNAGKSTLLSQLTSAQPKLADYPFTTLTPNLGVLKTDLQTITVADMPGIIEGASTGKGLGVQFLRHIERTKILIYIIDITQKNPLNDLETIRNEISTYNPEILKKEQILVFNKIDLLKKKMKLSFNLPTFYISAKTGIGIDELLVFIEKIQK